MSTPNKLKPNYVVKFGVGTKDPKTKDPIYKGPKVTKDPKLHRTQNKVYYKGPKITKDPIYKRPKITKDPIYKRPNVTKDPIFLERTNLSKATKFKK